jgi:CheY-like chemotaxis protein
MSAKILVVDDSLTIQKVVNITLANTGYDLTSAHDEDELFNKLEKLEYDLILLDFNLSEELTGYELVKKIKSINKNVKILVMIGTFDNVNDSDLEEAGIDESIIKPFESSKFTNLCKSLVDSIEVVATESSDSVFDDNGDEDEDWKVSSVNSEETIDVIEDSVDELDNENDNSVSEAVSPNSLKNEILGWGISLPDIIEAAEITRDMPKVDGIMPPKIDKSDELEFRASFADEESFEEDEDILGIQVSDDDLLFPEVLEEGATSSKLVSVDELKLEKDEVGFKVDDFVQNTELIEEIHQESDDFWAVDDEEETLSDKDITEEVKEIGPKLEDINDLNQTNISIEEIVSKVKEELRGMIGEIIEEKIKEVSSEVVERVAWEAIPDLAENIIQSEIKALSEKIQDKHSLR